MILKFILNILHTLLYNYAGNMLSRGAGYLAYRKSPAWLVKVFIQTYFLKMLKVDLSEAVHPEPSAYPRTIDFFTRALTPKARPIAKKAKGIVSPCDGKVLTVGTITPNGTYQIKGQRYTLADLLASDLSTQLSTYRKTKSKPTKKEKAPSVKAPSVFAPFIGGEYALIYLSPRDCHRIYAPLGGKLEMAEEVKGSLYPVKESFLGTELDVFGRNKKMRLVFTFGNHTMIMIWVGAFNVGTFQTTFDPAFHKEALSLKVGGEQLLRRDYNKKKKMFKAGAELGAFELGSSVLLFLSKGAGKLKLTPRQLMLGESIGQHR